MALKGNNRRSRHLKFETWWGLFLKAGFRASAFSSYTIQQAQLFTKPVQEVEVPKLAPDKAWIQGY
jgi:hypothetical protein